MMRVAIFASYDRKGEIAPYVIYYLQGLKVVADKIVFIADNEASLSEREKIKDLVVYSRFERHACYDFGSYRRGYEWAEENGLLDDADELIFCNDSCYGPVYPFSESFARMDKKDCDFWGMVSSRQVRYHLQSYFLVFKRNVFRSESFISFVKLIEKQKDFWSYVQNYEESFAEHLMNAGFRCSSLIDCNQDSSPYKTKNPTLFPMSILKEGMPLVERKMFGFVHRSMLNESLESTLSTIKALNKDVYNYIWYDNNAVVLIPIYKTNPSVDESCALSQVLQVLPYHDIRFVCPKGLDTSVYDSIVGHILPKEYFDKKYFDGIDGYNLLMTNVDFYRRFSCYEYMLIYQLDAWVFSDELAKWCAKGYDYIGAPWFEKHKTYEEGYPLWRCGNGGFSLRRISKFIEVTNPHTRIYPHEKGLSAFFRKLRGKNNMAWYREQHAELWEDTYFSFGLDETPHKMKCPSAEEAAAFSFECSPEYLYNEVTHGKLPFGCHAWRKMQYEAFWSNFIDVKMNKVSIVTINFNNLEGLKKTRDSISCQTYKNFEWIVIDGGSTDGSVEYIEKHSDEMSFWCSEKDEGIYNAQNKGTIHASGDYIIYMNSGDCFFDNHVLDYIFVDFQNDDVLYGDWKLIYSGEKEVFIEPPSDVGYLFFFYRNLCHQAMFIKTQLLKDSPYDESYKLYADWAKWVELSSKGKTFKYIHCTICKFQMGGISTEFNTKESNRIKAEFYPSIIREWSERQESERQFFAAKRKKHNKIIRILVYVSSLLLVTNIITAILLLL